MTLGRVKEEALRGVINKTTTVDVSIALNIMLQSDDGTSHGGAYFIFSFPAFLYDTYRHCLRNCRRACFLTFHENKTERF